MRRQRAKVLLSMLLFVAVLLSSGAAAMAAQEVSSAQKRQIGKEITRLQKENPGAEVKLSRSGLPKSIEGIKLPGFNLGVSTPEQAIQAFLERYNVFLVEKPKDEIEVVSRADDPALPGHMLVRVQQKLNGVAIQGAEAVFVLDPARNSLNVEARLSTTPNVDTEPKIASEVALGNARDLYNKLLADRPDLARAEASLPLAPAPAQPALIIIKPSDVGGEIRDFRLAWKIKIGSFFYFMDALDGKLLARYSDSRSVLARKTFDLGGTESFPGTLVLEDPSTSQPGSVEQDALQAHEFAKRTYDFYLTMFNRDSYDNKGGELLSFVRFGSLENAFWSPDRLAMVYGPGFAEALDVVAHELTHAVTDTQARLLYQGESGALNEFFSDLFGAAVEGNWQIGEALPGFKPPSKPLRDMSDPHNGGFDRDSKFSTVNRGQPDRMTEAVKDSHKICSTTMDFFNGCVHFNSGIWNKVAFLASDGGSHQGQTVTGIGREKVTRIFYSAFLRLTSTAKFIDAVKTTRDVCSDMARSGSHGVSSADCGELDKALTAVGLR
jgi:Zn-dependent metalloprotease